MKPMMKRALRTTAVLLLSAFPAARVSAQDWKGEEGSDHRTVQVDPQVQTVLDKLGASGALADLAKPQNKEQAREAFRALSAFAGDPEAVREIENREIPGPGGNIRVRIYKPREGGAIPVLVYFHGGIFVAGSLETHDTILRALANRSGCIIVSVDYRLAPENTYPAATDDAYAATQWAVTNADSFGGDPQRVAVGGDGAGGNLAAAVALMAKDRGGPRLRYQLLIYPYTDILQASPSWWDFGAGPVLTKEGMAYYFEHYTTATTGFKNPYVSPLFAERLSGLPPALIVTAEFDPVRDEAEQYAHHLRDEGVRVKTIRYQGMVHGFFQMTGVVDTARKCLNETAKALRDALGGS